MLGIPMGTRLTSGLLRAARTCASISFTTAYALNFVLWWRQFRDPADPIVVYQMGKVGSSSVVATLRAACPDRQVFHAHHLQSRNIAADRRRQRRTRRLWNVPAILVSNHMIHGTLLARAWRRRGGAGRWQFVTLVRDPIATMISQLFQDLDVRHPGIVQRLSTSDAANYLRQTFFARKSTDEHPFDWFEKEMKPTLGIDVGAFPFDPDLGYCIVSGDGFDLLLLRLEDLDDVGPIALSHFLDDDIANVVRSNVTRDKSTGDLYAAFLDRLVVPDWYMAWAYGHPLVRHLYSANQIDLLESRWLDPERSPSTVWVTAIDGDGGLSAGRHDSAPDRGPANARSRRPNGWPAP